MPDSRSVHWDNKASLEAALQSSIARAENELLPLAFIDNALKKFAPLVAFKAEGGSKTFTELDQHAGAFAALLQKELGIVTGNAIAVMLPNSLAFPVTCLGILRTGACLSVVIGRIKPALATTVKE